MTEPTQPPIIPRPDPSGTGPSRTIASVPPRAVDDRDRHARVLLARACGGVPTPTLADTVAAYGPLATLAALRAEPDTARLFYRAPITSEVEDLADRDLEAAAALHARFLTPEDPGWPPGAAMCWQQQPAPGDSNHAPDDTPDDTGVRMAGLVGLWVRGSAPLRGGLRITVTGDRAASDYGRHVAGDWCAGLGEREVRVVCGGALGVETAAVQGALTGRGPAPIVVTNGGLDRFHPPANHDLFEWVVAAGGAVVSPYPFGVPASRARGYGRHPLTVALGDALLVVEAAARSAALDTAEHARRAGRPVLVVPGPVTSAHSVGAHRLARRGDAQLVGDLDDVIAAVRGCLTGALARPATGSADPQRSSS